MRKLIERRLTSPKRDDACPPRDDQRLSDERGRRAKSRTIGLPVAAIETLSEYRPPACPVPAPLRR